MNRFLVGAICLAGCGNSPAQLVASQSYALFNPVAGRIASDPTELIFTNVGTATTPALQVVKTGDPQFTVSEDDCHVTLAAGKSCHVSIVLDGALEGAFDGQLRVFALPLLDADVRLSGKVMAPALEVTSKLPGLQVPAGNAPDPIAFTVRNAGGGTTGPIAFAGGGGFHVVGDCAGRKLAGGESCDFTATSDEVKIDEPVGTRDAWVTATAIPGGLGRADVNVEVTLPRTVTVTDYSWNDLAVGTGSPHTFTITNPGPAALTGVSVSLADNGPMPVGFTFRIDQDSCSQGAPTEAHKSCNVTVMASGQQAGMFYGKLVVSANHYKPAVAYLTVNVH